MIASSPAYGDGNKSTSLHDKSVGACTISLIRHDLDLARLPYLIELLHSVSMEHLE